MRLFILSFVLGLVLGTACLGHGAPLASPTTVERGIQPRLTVVTFCGRPLYVTGISREGEYLMGSMEFLQSNAAAWTLFVRIRAQLPVVKGNPTTRTYDVEHKVDILCPRPA